jgi:capsular exopolysaccharide synthesis family protein
MSLGAHFQAIWRHRWAVLLLSIGVAVVVYIVGGTLAKTYSAQAQLSVTLPASATSGAATQTDVLFYATTYAEIAHTTPVLTAAVAASGLPIDELVAAKRVSVSASSTVGLLTVKATGPTPSEAGRLAKSETSALIAAVNAQQAAAVATASAPIQSQVANIRSQIASTNSQSSTYAALQAQLQTLEQSLTQAQLQPQVQVAVISPAVADSSPASPKPRTWALLAFVTALVVDAELAVGLDTIADRFSNKRFAEEVRDLTDLPVLGVIRGRRDPQRQAFRTLFGTLRLTRGAPVRHCAVTSAEPSVGKTRVASGLAVTAAEVGIPVTLVEADLRNPTIARQFGLADGPGLGDVLVGVPVGKSLQEATANPGLDVMAGGIPVDDPVGLLTDRLASAVIDELGVDELVIFDTPAIQSFPDALVVARACDTTVLVVDLHSSRRQALRGAVEQLREVGAHPVGVVVVGVRDSRLRARLPGRSRSSGVG